MVCTEKLVKIASYLMLSGGKMERSYIYNPLYHVRNNNNNLHSFVNYSSSNIQPLISRYEQLTNCKDFLV